MKKDTSLTGPPGLLHSTSIVSGMTLLSRVLGFVRDMVLAQIFGAAGTFDAFIVAFKIPNFMRRLFGEGAFAQAFVPVLSEFRAKESHEATQEFVSRIAGTLGVTVLLLVLLVELIAPLVILIFAPGFTQDPARYDLAVHMMRITFPYLLLISLVSFAGSVLNTFGRFGIPAFTPVLLNVALIAVAWFWAPYAATPIVVLAWGVLIGGALQLFLQWPYLRKTGLLPLPKLGFRDPGVRRVMKLMVPALFGVSVAQISLLIDNFFASFLPAGSISWLYFSDRLTYLPLGVIGVAIATVVLPALSRDHHNNSPQRYSQTLDWGLRLVLVFGVPAAVGLFTLAGPLLTTLFQHGKFDAFDVLMTRKSLMAYAIGLPGFMMVKVLVSGFYSRQNIKTPVKIAAVAVGLNIVLNVLLVRTMAHAGLALATSIAALFNAACLLFFLLKEKVYQPASKWRFFLLRVIVSAALMAGFVHWYVGSLSQWMAWPVVDRVMHLSLVIIASLLLYFLGLWLMGVRMADFRMADETHSRIP
jgi:putative peptidoglycan lipid II flippase